MNTTGPLLKHLLKVSRATEVPIVVILACVLLIPIMLLFVVKRLYATRWKKWRLEIFAPDEVVLNVMSKLRIVDLVHCSSVSKQWNRVSKDDGLWKKFFERDFKGSLKPFEETWHRQYIVCYKKAQYVEPKWLQVYIQQKTAKDVLKLLALPFAISIIVILVPHVVWQPFPWQEYKDFLKEDVHDGLGLIIALFVLLWLVVVNIAIPLLDVILETFVDPVFMAITVGNKTFGYTLEILGINLTDHSTIAILLAATLFVIILLCIGSFFIVYDMIKTIELKKRELVHNLRQNQKLRQNLIKS